MKLTIPFVVQYQYTERGAHRQRRYRALLDVDVREAGNTEAPIALRWASGGFNRETPTNSGLQEVRVYGGDGQVYEPILTTNGPEPMVPLPVPEQRHEPFLKLCDMLRVTDPGRGIATASDIATPFPKRPTEKLQAEHRAAEMKACLFARDHLLIVNGTVWARSALPMLVVRRAQGSGEHGAYLHLMHPEQMKSGDWPNAFAPCDREDAEAELKLRAQEKGANATWGLGAGVRSLEIVEPALCAYDLSELHRRNLLHAVRNALAEALPRGNPEMAIAYDRIRKVLEAREPISNEREERLIEAGYDAYASCGGDQKPRLERMVARMRQLSQLPSPLPAFPGF